MATDTRVGISLTALALGSLAIGTTEFASMGVLPGYAHALDVSIPTAGHAISAYAIGVVVGAPLITMAAARWRRKRLALILAAAVALTNLSSAFVPTFGFLTVSRFLSGLPHGAYFGTIAVIASALVPPGRQARAIATVMSGLMIANIAGVPAATWLGQTFGWRSAYVAVAVMATVTVIAVAWVVPDVEAGPSTNVRGELGALRSPQVWVSLGTIAIGFGGLFAVYSYISPILTEVAGYPRADVPAVLAVFGLGLTFGNWFGGILADWRPRTTMVASMVGSAIVLATMPLTLQSRAGAAVSVFLLGVLGVSPTPAMIQRLMDAAGEGASLAAASFHSAFNIANAFGAALGGAVLSVWLGYRMPPLVGAALPVLGLVVLSIGLARERRRGDLT